MSEKRRAYEIDEDTFILDTSGVGSDEDGMRRQADYSFQVVRNWFLTGALRIIPSDDEKETEGCNDKKVAKRRRYSAKSARKAR